MERKGRGGEGYGEQKLDSHPRLAAKTPVIDRYYGEQRDQQPLTPSIARDARAGSKFQTNTARNKAVPIITSPLLSLHPFRL